MCFLRAKPIGVMQMLDQGEQDDKVGRLSVWGGRAEGAG
jgi:inorganic pyrophosphatase